MATIAEDFMRVPRLELRWRDLPEPKRGDYTWTCECVYSLVLALGQYDIRAEQHGRTLTIEMGRTHSTGAAARRYYPEEDKVETPFRDGAHAWWDSKQLGNPPIYAVAAGRAELLPDRDKSPSPAPEGDEDG